MSDSPRLALATYHALPNLSDDDQLLIDPLRQRGVDAVAVSWDDGAVDWSSFDGVVVRSCWDYHHRHDEFLAWLDRLVGLGVRVWNPPELVRWNSDKKYLLELARQGISAVPTVLVPRADERTLISVMCEHSWPRVVVKPSVSASAHETWLTSVSGVADHQSRFASLLERGDVLVQPYVSDVAEHGEWSLIFLGDRFSHAVLKRPAAGDFRVQTEHGGTFERREAPDALVSSAANVLRAVPTEQGRLYGRVDGYAGPSGELVLMELELIEPLLFLAECDGAAAQFATVICDALGGPSSRIASRSA